MMQCTRGDCVYPRRVYERVCAMNAHKKDLVSWVLAMAPLNLPIYILLHLYQESQEQHISEKLTVKIIDGVLKSIQKITLEK